MRQAYGSVGQRSSFGTIAVDLAVPWSSTLWLTVLKFVTMPGRPGLAVTCGSEAASSLAFARRCRLPGKTVPAVPLCATTPSWVQFLLVEGAWTVVWEFQGQITIGEDAAGEVHDRMPVFVTPASWDTWLAPEKLEKDQVGDVLDLLDVESRAVASTLRTRPVSRAVNNVRTLDRRDAGLIKTVTRGGGDR